MEIEFEECDIIKPIPRNKKISMKYSNASPNTVQEVSEEHEDVLEAMKMKCDIFNSGELYDQIDDLIFNEKGNSPSNSSSSISKKYFEKTKYASKESFVEFFSKYHRNEEIIRKDKPATETPSFKFIEAAKMNKIISNPMGLVKRDGEENIINLNHYRLGDNYVKSLAHSMKLSNHLTEINLSENRLSNLSICPLLQTIKDNQKLKISNLNLGYNKLGKESIDMLCSLMEEKDSELSHLNLESNALGNKLIDQLLTFITKFNSNKIKYLNLSKNNLSDEVSYTIANLVENCNYLEVLILSYNGLKNYGASNIVNKIKNHSSMKVLDLSWNIIGNNLFENVPSREELQKSSNDENKHFSNAEMSEIQVSMDTNINPNLGSKKLNPLRNTVTLFAKELGEVISEKESGLIHLDISYNNIGYLDAVHLSEVVKVNHTILGLHCDGNEMTIDELGFIQPVEKANYQANHFANSQIHYKIDNEHPLIKSNVISVRKIRAKNNCWICEGWKETKFIYKPQSLEKNKKMLFGMQLLAGLIEEENDDSSLQVKLHLHFENYKPFDTVMRAGQYLCHRMCPPGDLLFYYTINGVPVESYGKIAHRLKDAILHQELTEDGEVKQHIITKVGRIHVEINPNVIDSNTYRKLIRFCEPRPEKKKVRIIRPKTPWTFPISIWALYDYNYEGDSESYIEETFEHDFTRAQFLKEAKSLEVLGQLRTILKGYFTKIIDCYRYYSSVLGSSIWQINKISLLELVNNCPGFISDGYNFNDVVLQQTSIVNAMIDKEERTKNKNKNLPDNIVRHQFMALLVKMAKDKYMSRNKTYDSLTDAVTAAFETNYMPVLKGFDVHKWRVEKYYKEVSDNLVKAYFPIFDAVYKSWAPIKEPGRRDTWMILDEFNNLMIQIVDSEYPIREIPISFNYSIRLQINEIETDRHLKMLFPEFIEAFCRVIDKYSPYPPDDNADEWNMQLRQEQPLATKLENAMPRFIKMITHPDYKYLKDKFNIPQRDEETELLKYDVNNPQYAGIMPKKRVNNKTK